ncbi:MAG: hemolysin [Solirubrobacteraceae bacterium]|jgi:hemolysin III|nr:hemolysin [Solirubrobacteraceae bacterium]
MTGRRSIELPDEIVPRLRGLLHAYAFFAAIVCAAVLVVLAPDGRARTGAIVYGAGLCALFGVSGAYHRWRGAARIKRMLRRADHATIFVFIAASYTPVALLALSGTMRWVVLCSAWAGALAGVSLSVGWIDASRRLTAVAYIALGWIAVVAFPQLASRVGAVPFALLVAGGLLYSAGACIYAAQRPDPWPRTFGFHELFHALVVAAALAHLAVLGPLIASPPPGT